MNLSRARPMHGYETDLDPFPRHFRPSLRVWTLTARPAKMHAFSLPPAAGALLQGDACIKVEISRTQQIRCTALSDRPCSVTAGDVLGSRLPSRIFWCCDGQPGVRSLCSGHTQVTAVAMLQYL